MSLENNKPFIRIKLLVLTIFESRDKTAIYAEMILPLILDNLAISDAWLF